MITGRKMSPLPVLPQMNGINDCGASAEQHRIPRGKRAASTTWAKWLCYYRSSQRIGELHVVSAPSSTSSGSYSTVLND